MNGKTAVVDLCDLKLFWARRWRVVVSGGKEYLGVRIGPNRKLLLFHRELLGAPDNQVVDHINGCGLDNSRQNIRLCSQMDNLKNRKKAKNNVSGYKGVYPKISPAGTTRWIAEIGADRKRYRLGAYSTPLEAAKAYDEAALKLHGKFAKTNLEMGLLGSAKKAQGERARNN